MIFSTCWIDRIDRIKWIDLLDPIDLIDPINPLDPIDPTDPTLRKFPLDLCEPKFKKKLLYHLLKTVISKFFIKGPVVKWSSRLLHTQKVPGSNPGRTI